MDEERFEATEIYEGNMEVIDPDVSEIMEAASESQRVDVQTREAGQKAIASIINKGQDNLKELAKDGNSNVVTLAKEELKSLEARYRDIRDRMIAIEAILQREGMDKEERSFWQDEYRKLNVQLCQGPQHVSQSVHAHAKEVHKLIPDEWLPAVKVIGQVAVCGMACCVLGPKALKYTRHIHF